MNRTTLLGSIAAIAFLLLSLNAHAQDPGGRPGDASPVTNTQLIDAEFEVELQKLEHKMSQLAVEEGTLELEKIELELKQTSLRVDMRRIQSEMERVQIEQARFQLQHMREPISRDRQREIVQRESLQRRRRQREADEAPGPDRAPPPIRELSTRVERLERMVRELTRSSQEDE